jgi:hypothetical protein
MKWCDIFAEADVSGEASGAASAASLLHAVGLPELVCDNLQEYEALALKLALAPAELTAIRRKLEATVSLIRCSIRLASGVTSKRHIGRCGRSGSATSRRVTSALLRNGPLCNGGEDVRQNTPKFPYWAMS